MKEQYQLGKWIWDHNNFEQMGWHDSPIWAMSFDDNVKFDLDYIFNWVKPENENGSYRFWISPVTLVFKNPTKFKVEMETDFVNGLEIADIDREIKNGKSTFIIEAQEGRILIETEEFRQIVRRPPTLQISQALSELERGPISFSEISEKDFKPSERAIRGRELSYKFDDLRSEKNKLQIGFDEFNFEQLIPKDRILKKREFKDKIEQVTKAVQKIEVEMNKIYGEYESMIE